MQDYFVFRPQQGQATESKPIKCLTVAHRVQVVKMHHGNSYKALVGNVLRRPFRAFNRTFVDRFR